MGELITPPKAATGVLTIGGVDFTCFLRKAGITDDGGSETDLGTWCDPGASGRSPAKETFEAEFRQSFTDGASATKAFYDAILPLADGSVQAVVWHPFGDHGPAFTFNTSIPIAPIGAFQVEQATFVNVAWGVQDKTYTAATST